MKPGQGFARRVTVENLENFAPFLLPSEGAETSDLLKDTPEKSVESDTALKAAEALFAGESIKLKRSFRSSQKATVSRQTAPRDKTFVLRVDSDGDVLIAEIPKGSVRWKQANFNKQDFIGFFHADGRQLKLWHVREDGTVLKPKMRPGVSVKSHNFRIELDAATGLQYPRNGRPIGVFLRISREEFRYMLLMPGTDNHNRAKEILTQFSLTPKGRAKRLRVHSREMRAAWAELPIWP